MDSVKREFDEKTIFNHLVKALAALHGRKFVHRNLKPTNIFIAKDDEGKKIIKLGDFRKAKNIENEPEYSNPKLDDSYKPPEVLNNHYEQEQFSWDVFSLAVIIASITCEGGHPFRREKTRIIDNIRDEQFSVYQQSWKPNLKPMACESDGKLLTALIKRMLRYEPSERPSMARIKNDVYFKSSENKQYYCLYSWDGKRAGKLVIFNQIKFDKVK